MAAKPGRSYLKWPNLSLDGMDQIGYWDRCSFQVRIPCPSNYRTDPQPGTRRLDRVGLFWKARMNRWFCPVCARIADLPRLRGPPIPPRRLSRLEFLWLRRPRADSPAAQSTA